MMTPEKPSPALKAVFSTANMNGTAALLMSLAMGSAPSSALYIAAVLTGTFNKYRSLKNSDAEPDRKGRLSRILMDPSITARVLMLAASYNFLDSSIDAITGPEEDQAANFLRMFGWSCGFLGDNALRKLDAANFQENKMPGTAKPSKLRVTFNALTANPTLFYNGASMAFTLAILSGKASSGFSSLEGGIGLAAMGLVLTGVGHAIRRAWKAAKGEIGTDGINDGVMNYCSSASKAAQSSIAIMTGNYWLAAAQLIFTGSNIKLIYETREALGKKDAIKDPSSPGTNQVP